MDVISYRTVRKARPHSKARLRDCELERFLRRRASSDEPSCEMPPKERIAYFYDGDIVELDNPLLTLSSSR
ncbi:hypothetical protein BHM03_00002053 [Ensete ventricosum]|uniref:Uncharacterized protein n=1 Tax=Ensete ventricosum TaxID=4639 RepID=A0A426YPA0_ENSVE|nr:hypothetical protein B296_00046158 [Ensete ventricosum]RZR77077.1 hypothetical protein BHM03_00002053 [Ensete ventricosum]